MSQAWIASLGLALAMSHGAAAETGTFDLSLAGVRAGVLSYSGDEVNGRYGAAGAVRSAGLAGMFLDARVDTSSRGKVSGNSYAPSQYSEQSARDDKDLSVSYAYKGGIPAITRDPPRKKPRKHAVDPSGQKGTVDPMTTAYALLRDRPRDLACKLTLDMYDGAQRSNIRLVRSEPRGDGGVTCHGEYRRIAGFSPKEMAEKPVWPFTVLYEPASGDMLRVDEVQVPTTFGMLRMRRR